MSEECLDYKKIAINHKGKDIVLIDSFEGYYFEDTDGRTIVFDNQADIIDIVANHSERLCSDKKIKDFEKLGEIYFELIKNDNIIESEEIRILVDSILDKNDIIAKLEDEINNA